MVFEYNSYEAGGGLWDCLDSFDTLDEALKHSIKSTYDVCQIFDRIEGIEIKF